MRIASFERRGTASFGIVTDAGIVDLGGRIAGVPDLRSALGVPGGLDALRPFADRPPDFGLADIAFFPPIPRSDKVIGIGLNYRDHAAEQGAPIPAHPVVFVRWPGAQTGHLRPLVRPRVSVRFDFEGELAVIIGRRARHVAARDALDHVAGYACFNDGSVRDWQRHSAQFTPGKNFPHSGAFGPWLVTRDEIADPGALDLTTRLNGEVVQEGRTSDMIFGVAAIIAYVSTFTELLPGDVIATGTPKGVGDNRKPPLYLKAGDTVEVTIDGIGTLRNPVVDEA